MTDSPIGSDHQPIQPQSKAPLPLNIRAAGFCMLVMAIFTFSLGALLPEGGFHATSGVFDLVLGAMLVAGNRSGLAFTKFRTWVGLIIGTPMMMANGGAIEGGGQLLWCLGMLALLAEKPGKPRMILGGLLMICNLALVSLGALILHFGLGPFNAMAYRGKTLPVSADRVAGLTDGSLRFKSIGPAWELMKPEEIKVQNDLFALWLIDPRADRHVAVLPEPTEGQLDLMAYRDSLVANMANSKVVGQEKHPLGQLIRFHETTEGVELDRLVLLIVRPKQAVQVHAWCQTSEFPKAEPEFRKLLDSLEVR